MSIITAVGLVWVFVAFAVCMSGVACKNEDVAIFGVVLIVLFGVSAFSFQIGAAWQHFDTLSKYELIELKTP